MYTETYSKVVRYMKSPWEFFKQRLDAEPSLRWGSHPEAPSIRPIAADAYQDETGDEQGANFIRDPQQHIIFDEDGQPHKADFNHWGFHHLVGVLSDYLIERGAIDDPFETRIINNKPHVFVHINAPFLDENAHLVRGAAIAHEFVPYDQVGPTIALALNRHLSDPLHEHHLEDETVQAILHHIINNPYERATGV